MDFAEVVRKRRMVRSFTEALVAPEALERMLDVARRGPSAGYSQGVEFVVVTDEAARRTLARADDPRLKASGLRNFAAQAPVLVVVCASSAIYTSRYHEPDKMRLRPETPDERFWHVPYWHTDAGASLMLLLLAAVNEGLGAGVAGVMGPEGQERIRQATGMPDSYTAVAIVAIGHEAPDARQFAGSAATRSRRPLEEVVHRERW
jgi:nitroreductase